MIFELLQWLQKVLLHLWGCHIEPQARTTLMIIFMLIQTCSLVSKISGEKIVMQWRYKSWPDGL